MRRFAISVVAAVMAAQSALAAQTYGLVIGIDDYTYVPDLHGAVNDARDIADALSSLDAHVTLLIDAEATRAAIFQAWEAILDRAEPGDRLIVSFAGHGSNEPEHTPGSERDGRDENFLLSGFAPRGAAAGERIRDDEIAGFLDRSAGLEVIFVADACHAGTVTRNIDPVLGFRYVENDGIAADPLPPPPPPSAPSDGQSTVALFLAAVDETQRVPEVLIDGQPRGALSYAFASGLRGEADRNGDGLLTKGELESHVRRIVRLASDGVQLPQSRPVGQETRALIELGTRSQPAPPAPPAPLAAPDPVAAAEPVAIASPTPEPSLRELGFDALPPILVSGSGWADHSGIEITAYGTLRRQGDTVLSGVGDVVAHLGTATMLRHVIDAQRLSAGLDALADPVMAVSFAEGDRAYLAGEELVIEVSGRTGDGLSLVNMGADGTLSYLYPVPSLDDPLALSPDAPFRLPVQVTAPYGADHVIAIETSQAPDLLRNRLRALSGTRDVAALWDLLREPDLRLAVFPFFTTEAGQ